MRTYITTFALGLMLVAVIGFSNVSVAQVPLDNNLTDHVNWDLGASPSPKWNKGNSGGWTEGDTVPHLVTLTTPADSVGTLWFLDICLDHVVADIFGYNGAAPYGTTIDPGVDENGAAISIDDTEGFLDAENADVTSVVNSGQGPVNLCSDAGEWSWRVEFTVPTPGQVTRLYFGGVLSKPGDARLSGGAPIPVDSSASNKAGVWQSRIASGGEKATQITSPIAIVLPVELVDFSARFEGTDAVLNWQTASETNNAGFSIEHSSNGSPFAEVGYVDGGGTTLNAIDYSFRVANVDAGTHQFRLKQIDFDGAFEYSAIVETVSEVPGTHMLSSAYPNPFNPSTSFSLLVSASQDVQIALYDALGRQVRNVYDGGMEANVAKVFTVDAEGLPSGTYMYVVSGNNFRDSRNIVLLK